MPSEWVYIYAYTYIRVCMLCVFCVGDNKFSSGRLDHNSLFEMVAQVLKFRNGESNQARKKMQEK